MTRFFKVRRHPGGQLHRRGSITFEWIMLFTLLLIGALAGFAALNYSIVKQQDAVGASVAGMNFPADTSLPSIAISSSATSTAQPLP